MKDNQMLRVFPSPPMVAYRQARNSSLKSLLVKSKLPEKTRTRRNKNGMRKCNTSNCQTCPFVMETTLVKSSSSQSTVRIQGNLNCVNENVVYCIQCTKPACKNIQYIGETGRKFNDRFKEHLGYVRSCNLSQPTGAHFTLPGHSISDMKTVILEQCKDNSPTYRKVRESFIINKFNTLVNGMNKKR